MFGVRLVLLVNSTHRAAVYASPAQLASIAKQGTRCAIQAARYAPMASTQIQRVQRHAPTAQQVSMMMLRSTRQILTPVEHVQPRPP